MNGKEIRFSKLVNSKSKKSVIIPIDHGLVMGNVLGLENPFETLKKLVELNIDGILLTPGIMKTSSEFFRGKNMPARILTVDYPMMSVIPGESDNVIEYNLISSVEFALKWDCEAVKVLFPWGLEKEIQMKIVKLTAELAQKCDDWGIPLMVEPVLLGEKIPVEKKKDPSMIEHASRIALEIGADILKVPYLGEMNRFETFIKRIKLPVFVLGGPKMESVLDMLKVAEESIKAGATGLIFGRNIWQNPDMEKLIEGLKEIVHNNKSSEEVAEKYSIK